MLPASVTCGPVSHSEGLSWAEQDPAGGSDLIQIIVHFVCWPPALVPAAKRRKSFLLDLLCEASSNEQIARRGMCLVLSVFGYAEVGAVLQA